MRIRKCLNVLAIIALGACLWAGCGDSGVSAPPACDDGVWNGEETDLDCGGDCPACAAGGGCKSEADCASGICSEGKCQAASCSDGLRNGYETDVDCGGTCPGCAETQHCLVGNNCVSGVCVQNECAAPSCDDGVHNGDELGPDCGPECGPCPAGYPCADASDCTSGSCAGICLEPTCDDGVLNGSESDEDCGGACEACEPGRACDTAADCDSGVCEQGVCQAPSCEDGVTNGDELGIDCAGSCPACPGGTPCVLDSQCASLTCTDGICEAPTCDDLLTNGDETDVDCGGSCPPCGFNEDCLVFSDCSSGICGDNGRCAYGENCAHILSASPGAPDGLYQIDPEQDGYLPLWAYCDMHIDGGGWTLVANYLHVGGTNPQLYNSPDALPWKVSSSLGDDEQGTYSWRHTQNALFATLAVDELRFEAATSAHERRMHFKTDLARCIDYFATGAGSCEGLQKRYTPLEGHDARLPDWADTFSADRANQAMTDFPFCASDVSGQELCWAVRGDENQWAADHIRAGSGFDTLHRIWVRAEPSHCTDNARNHSETDTDCGGMCAPCAEGAACHGDADCFGLCISGVCMTPPNCTEILVYRPSAEDGVYGIDPDGAAGPYPPMKVFCDMTSDGGGWTLVLNYLHAAGTDPELSILSDRLPEVGSGRLGKDDSGSEAWGHVDQGLFAALDPAEVRFYGKTSAHERLTNFASDSADCIAYLSGDESMSCGDINWRYRPLDGHDARLPAAMDGAAQLSGDLDMVVMTSQPFYANHQASWNLGFGEWSVDQWRGGTRFDSLHRVFVRSVPSHCSDGVRSGDETDIDCGGSCAGCAPGQSCAWHEHCVTGLCEAGQCGLLSDCSGIKSNNPDAASGDYLVDLDGEGGLDPTMVSCDMATAGGGWTLVANYLHAGGTSPATAALADRLPLRGSDVLGPDESGSDRWGHAGNSLFALLSVDEVRFQGKSSAHDRVTHYASADADCIAYFGSGAGHDCSGVISKHKLLSGHTAMLPAMADNFRQDEGDSAMLMHPVWMGWHFHWVVGVGNRWETDDYVNNNSAYTLHRIWVRAAPDHCDNGQPDGDEEGVDCGGSCPAACSPVALGEPCAAHHHCVTGTCASDVCATAENCTALLSANPEARSGNYLIDPDGLGPIAPFFATCDMSTDGGGWTLVMNYVHAGGTDPATLVRPNDLPQKGSNIYGADESASGFWGHADTDLMAALDPAEIRFDGISQGVHRFIHFSTVAPWAVEYLVSGLGTFSGLQSYYRLLPGHSANLPAAADSFYSDRSDNALLDFPFYQGGSLHWGIFNAGTGSGRWEVDDYQSPSGSGQNTRHRVWLRSAVTLLYDNFDDADYAGWAIYDETESGGPSNWIISGNTYLQQTTNIGDISSGIAKGSIAYWSAVSAQGWTDYRFAARLYNADNDDFGIVFRMSDEQNFYRLHLCNDTAWCNYSMLTKMVEGTEHEIARISGNAYPQNLNFPVEVQVKGNRIRVWTQGAKLFDVYDDAHPAGTVGVFCAANTDGYFDEILVLEGA